MKAVRVSLSTSLPERRTGIKTPMFPLIDVFAVALGESFTGVTEKLIVVLAEGAEKGSNAMNVKESNGLRVPG
jgi:hypothetical protein